MTVGLALNLETLQEIAIINIYTITWHFIDGLPLTYFMFTVMHD